MTEFFSFLRDFLAKNLEVRQIDGGVTLQCKDRLREKMETALFTKNCWRHKVWTSGPMEKRYAYIVTVSSVVFAIRQVAAKADQKMRFDIDCSLHQFMFSQKEQWGWDGCAQAACYLFSSLFICLVSYYNWEKHDKCKFSSCLVQALSCLFSLLSCLRYRIIWQAALICNIAVVNIYSRNLLHGMKESMATGATGALHLPLYRVAAGVPGWGPQ